MKRMKRETFENMFCNTVFRVWSKFRVPCSLNKSQSSFLYHSILFILTDALVEFDLMNVFKIPLEEGVDFVDGSDGFPAFKVLTSADVKSPYRLALPEKLEEFAIMLSIRPESRSGGYIFSVVNPMDTIVQLGLYASEPTAADRWNITFYYTDPSIHMTSQPLATFEAPFGRKWTKLALKVLYNRVIFYYNCVEMESKSVSKSPPELVFDSASTLYLAQGGSLLKGKFEVSGQLFNISPLLTFILFVSCCNGVYSSYYKIY